MIKLLKKSIDDFLEKKSGIISEGTLKNISKGIAEGIFEKISAGCSIGNHGGITKGKLLNSLKVNLQNIFAGISIKIVKKTLEFFFKNH